ncbi:MAG: hypothetical protein R3258_04340 [Acidimicrobiia bacterium]|nr:hypothetical protein [Acidimicrobiia bacterium]
MSYVAEAGIERRTLAQVGPALVLSSVLGSTLGIVIAQFLDDLGDGLLAEILGAEAVLYNNRVEISGEVSDLVWAGGFVLCLLVGFLALFAYPTQKGYGIPRLTLLWMTLHVLRQGLTQAVQLPLDDESQLALAYDALNAPPGLDVVIAAGGGVGLLLIALSAAAAFLAFAPHRSFVKDGRRRFTFTLWIAVIPAVASAFASILAFLPDSEMNVIPTLPLVPIMFLATLLAAPGTSRTIAPEDERVTPWPWGLAVTVVVVVGFYFLILEGGAHVDPRLWEA